MGGDFNIYTHKDDKMGSGHHDIGGMAEFSAAIQSLSLLDAGYNGNRFTWYHGQHDAAATWERIDRVLYNKTLIKQNDQYQVLHLPIHLSDHSPLIFKKFGQNHFHSSFKIFKMWTNHPLFLSTVETAWHTNCTDPPLFKLQKKPELVKKELKKWNVETFGNIHQRVFTAQDELAAKEFEMQHQWSDTIEKNGSKQKLTCRQNWKERRVSTEKNLVSCGCKKVTRIRAFFRPL